MPVTNPFICGADPAGQPVAQALRLTNNHGLIGKTMTLQWPAQAFSYAVGHDAAKLMRASCCGAGGVV